MKEKELREKMAGLYGCVPEDTHAAFEHALTHHRQREAQTVRVSKTRFAVAVALLVMLLATGAYAVYYRFSVTDFMRNSSQAFLDHVITLDETYENDLFTMTVNDLVFDGSTFAVAMNILRHDPDSAYYMRTKVTAVCADKDYMVDVEGWNGPDFLAGGMWPEYDGFYKDPVAAERQGFGFEGVLWDWDMNPPPAGEPIEWTMTFNVFRPIWEIVVDNDVTKEPDFDAALEARCLEAYQNHQIFMYSGDANSYVLVLANELDLPWDMPWEDMLLATGAFELADVITFHFTTDFDDDVVKEELIGQRFELGECAAVINTMGISFQRANGLIYLDVGRDLSSEELKEVQAALPTGMTIICRDAAGEEVCRNSASVNPRWVDEDLWRFAVGFDFYQDMSDVASMTFQGYRKDGATGARVPMEDFLFTVELP